jgi:RNA polymerase sigma-70 factor (ECF subfamily)
LRRHKNAPIPHDSIPPIPAPEADLELRYIRQEKMRSVHAAMKTLKPEYRQVLWLIYFEGFSCAQAAKILKKSTHNTEVLVSRARQVLKKQLIKEGFDYENF